jgi:hypothetical protein
VTLSAGWWPWVMGADPECWAVNVSVGWWPRVLGGDPECLVVTLSVGWCPWVLGVDPECWAVTVSVGWWPWVLGSDPECWVVTLSVVTSTTHECENHLGLHLQEPPWIQNDLKIYWCWDLINCCGICTDGLGIWHHADWIVIPTPFENLWRESRAQNPGVHLLLLC